MGVLGNRCLAEYLSPGRKIQATQERQPCRLRKGPPRKPGRALAALRLALHIVVLGFVDVLALLIQILMQIDALLTCERAVRLVLLLRLTNLTTPLTQALRFIVRQLARLHAIHQARSLIALTLIHSRIANRRRH